MINKKLTFFQTFNAMRIFLSIYNEKHETADLSILLSSLRLFQDRSDWKDNIATWDPAALEDWMDGVHKTLKDLHIQKDPKSIFYDKWMAFLCMKNYLQLFYNEIPYEIIGKILNKLNKVQKNKNTQVWNDWLRAVKHAKHETYQLDEPLQQ